MTPTNQSPGAVSTHQRICWPAVSAAKSSKPVVRLVAQMTTPFAVSPAMSRAQQCTTSTTQHSMFQSTIVTTLTSVSVHHPIESTALSPHHPSATCHPSPTPRHSTLSARAPPAPHQAQEAHRLPSARFPPRVPTTSWSRTRLAARHRFL